MSSEDRYWDKVRVGDGCWEWIGGKIPDGYGQMLWNGRLRLAHRIAYELHYGEPPADDMTVDHLCRNRGCVNPAHLEQVSNRENILRGIGPTAVNARKTHCVHGHPFDETNTKRRSDGGRRCRACERRVDRARRVRERERARVGL